jgi:hypothetical protein
MGFMKRNLLIFIIFLIVIISPILKSSVVNSTVSSKNIIIDNYKNINSINTIKLAIFHSKEDGSFNYTIKEIIKEDYEFLINNLTNKISQIKNYDKPFKNIFKVLKEKNLIEDDIDLFDIFSEKTSVIYDSTAYNLSVMEPFVSLFAPIVAVGMGFGAGIGDKFGSVTGLLYSGGVIGLGGVICLDAIAKTLYVQYTFTFPLLIHVLSSFVGIMMFPVDFDFISNNYLPFFIYSNFIAIGYSALAIGFPLGL